MMIVTCIKKVASKEFEVTKEDKREAKETWWWNEKVQKAIKEKKECFRRMHLSMSADNVERYKVAKKIAKRAVSEVRGQMYDGLYQQLGTKEGENDIYRMAKSRESKTRDII
jgi:acyl-CoA hydrolase